ncbi:MAG: hypothetical protein EKK42_06990 [Pseudonocardiaceae bacterium]|nr:MAG: hypothetical protein EKK42_06990 [Pseudonocardiaceae bacterium]
MTTTHQPASAISAAARAQPTGFGPASSTTPGAAAISDRGGSTIQDTVTAATMPHNVATPASPTRRFHGRVGAVPFGGRVRRSCRQPRISASSAPSRTPVTADRTMSPVASRPSGSSTATTPPPRAAATSRVS